MPTRNLGLTVMTESQQNKWITHNTALHELDTWIGGVKSRTTSGPPASPAPAEGHAYIVDDASGAWSGFTVGDLAIYYRDSAGSTAWINLSPAVGPTLYVEDEDFYVRWNGSEWDSVGAVSGVEDSADTSYTLSLSDSETILRFTSSSPVAVTVPPQADVDFPIGSTITIRRAGTGAVTISAGSPAPTINGSVTLSAQHDYVTLIKIGADEWDAY